MLEAAPRVPPGGGVTPDFPVVAALGMGLEVEGGADGGGGLGGVAQVHQWEAGAPACLRGVGGGEGGHGHAAVVDGVHAGVGRRVRAEAGRAGHVAGEADVGEAGLVAGTEGAGAHLGLVTLEAEGEPVGGPGHALGFGEAVFTEDALDAGDDEGVSVGDRDGAEHADARAVGRGLREECGGGVGFFEVFEDGHGLGEHGAVIEHQGGDGAHWVHGAEGRGVLVPTVEVDIVLFGDVQALEVEGDADAVGGERAPEAVQDHDGVPISRRRSTRRNLSSISA